MPSIEAKKRFIINTLFLAVICVIAYFVMKYLLIWLLPFVIGFLCSLVLQRPVRWLANKTKIPKGIWSVIFVTVILSIVFALISLVFFRLYTEITDFIKALNSMIPSLTEDFKALGLRISDWLDSLPGEVTDYVSTLPTELATSGVSLLSQGVSSIAKAVILNVPGLLVTVIISIVACCFMTARYGENTAFILRQLSSKNQAILLKTKNLFMENIVKMLKGYIIIMFVTFIELFIGFSLLRLEYALILAVLIALLDVLPVLGTGTVIIPWAVFELILGDFLKGIELLILYGVITVIRNIIEPRIIGKQVGLSPVVTLMSMYLGLNLFGVFGMFGLPVILIILVKLQEAQMIKIWK